MNITDEVVEVMFDNSNGRYFRLIWQIFRMKWLFCNLRGINNSNRLSGSLAESSAE